MYRADAGRDRLARRAEGNRPALQQHFARIRLMHAGQDLDQCRFAGPVLAEQRVNLAAPDEEIDAVERLHADKGLGDAAHFDDRTAHDRRTAGAVPSRASRSRFSPTAARISRPSNTCT
jgi:hypothetical protein